MADINDRVMQMVEAEIRKNAKITTAELFERARKLDKSIDKLSARQFNARYPLQVKRRLSPPRRRRRGAPRRQRHSSDSSRAAVRQVLAQFAQDVAGAQNPGQVVALIADLDKYVDRIMKAAGRR